jgi:ABC-2 type transport system permease protein
MDCQGRNSVSAAMTDLPAVSRRRLIWQQSLFDLRLTLANGEQLLLTVIIPLAILIGLTFATGIDLGDSGSSLPRVSLALPGVLTVAMLSSAFASLAIATGFDRRSGSLLLLATTPLTRNDIVWARALATLALVLGQVVALSVVAAVLGWRPAGSGLISLGVIILGTFSLAACAVALAGLLRAEATLAVANGVFLVLLVAGGTALPATALPAPLAVIAQALPSGALGEALRLTMTDTHSTALWPAIAVPVVILVVWLLLGGFIARKTFRWS